MLGGRDENGLGTLLAIFMCWRIGPALRWASAACWPQVPASGSSALTGGVGPIGLGQKDGGANARAPVEG